MEKEGRFWSGNRRVKTKKSRVSQIVLKGEVGSLEYLTVLPLYFCSVIILI